jgi:hypothetical protein
MKTALLLLILTMLTATRVVAREQTPEEIDKMFGGYFTDPDWAKKHGFDENLPNPTGEQIDMVKRMGEIRQEYWEAYKEGGPKFEEVKLRFALVLFYRDTFLMLTDIAGTDMPDVFRSKQDMVNDLPYELLGNLYRLSGANGEPIPKSALGYFSFWSTQFHSDLKAKSRGGIPNYPAIPGIWKDAFPRYEAYVVARDWAELCRAPFPLPIEQYVCGLVQRWPVPAKDDQAEKDYRFLLTTFGKERVFEVARKVQAAMDQEGVITNPNALGIDPNPKFEEDENVKEYRRRLEDLDRTSRTSSSYEIMKHGLEFQLQIALREAQGDPEYYTHNPYEVLWTLLTRDDPKLARLYNILKDRKKRAYLGNSFYAREHDFALQSVVDEWSGIAPTPTPAPTALPPDPILVKQEQTIRQQYTKMWMMLPEERRLQLHDEEVKFEATLKIEGIQSRIQAIHDRIAYFRSLGAYELRDAPTPVPTVNSASTVSTPAFTPAPMETPTPYPEAADLWREREHVVKQEYDKAWTALPDATRLQLHDEEVTFRDTIKTFDPPTRMRTLKKRIEYLKSLAPRSAAVPTTPAPTPTPTPTAAPQALPESPLAPNATPTQNWKDQLAGELPTYDFAWSCLPNECKIKLHDEEVKFRESLKSLDDKTKFQMLQERIPYLENSAREANRPKVTPNPNTAAHTIRSSTPEEAEEEATLRKEYAKVWMELPASTRRLLHDAETDFDIKTSFSDPAVRNGLFRERIEYFRNLKAHDTEEQQRQEPTPAPTPVPAPAQTNAQEQMNFLAQEYDKMWEKFFAAQPESARPKLREEEIAFRASLKGITGNDLLQKITQRMVYFQTYTLTLPPVK